MMAMALTMRPPAPRPWMARKAMSSPMPPEVPPSRSDPAMPHSIEPTMKMAIDARKIVLRP